MKFVALYSEKKTEWEYMRRGNYMEHGLSWGLQLVKKFPVFYETQRFIMAFTRARHLSIFWARLIQPMPHLTSVKTILILSSHLCLDLASGLFPSGLPIKTLYAHLLSPYVLHSLLISFFLIWFVQSTDHKAPPFVVFSNFLIAHPS